MGRQPTTYLVDPGRSAVTARTGRAGLLKFAGHEHEIVAPLLCGEVVADAANLERSTVSLRFEAASLRVSGKDEPAGDVPKVQERMAGPELLDVARFPGIVFKSAAVAGKRTGSAAYELAVTGQLSVHGVTKTLVVAVRAEVSGDSLTATGSAILRHGDFGLTPVSVAGVVKVKNEIAVDYRIVARILPTPTGASNDHACP